MTDFDKHSALNKVKAADKLFRTQSSVKRGLSATNYNVKGSQ